jgi:hypothetical protein
MLAGLILIGDYELQLCFLICRTLYFSGDDMKERAMYMVDVDTMIKVYELAKEHGKIAGENIQEEFDEIKKLFPEKFKFMGVTDQDIDMLTGNLRESGFKIKNLKEEERRTNESN